MGIAILSDGTMYVADTENGAIRKVTQDGTVTTFVSDVSGPRGICFVAKMK
jgi:sugar lactone lactonase YvrE